MTCLKCRKDKPLTVHHIIPRCYTDRFAPGTNRFRSPEDTAKLCQGCHQNYERQATKLKSYLFAQTEPARQNYDTDKLKKKARAILRFDQGEPIPEQVINQYRQDVQPFLDSGTLSQLTELSTILNELSSNTVVREIRDIEEFANIWKEHFQAFLDQPL